MKDRSLAYMESSLQLFAGEAISAERPRSSTNSCAHPTKLSNLQLATVKVERLPDVCKRIGRSRSHLYSTLQVGGKYYDPDFPKPVKLGPSGVAVGWISTEVDSWIERQIARRDGKLKDNGQPRRSGQGSQFNTTEGGAA